MISQIDDSRWPPPPLPAPLRLKFLGLGWTFLTALVVTGLVVLYMRGFTLQDVSFSHLFSENLGLLGVGKLSFISIMVYAEFFTKKRSVKQASLVFLTALLIAGYSVLLVR